MRGYSMDIKIPELRNELPDGRTVKESCCIGLGHHAIHVSINGQEDTVFTHSSKAESEPNVFIGLCFSTNIETVKVLHLCVRSCTDDSEYSSIVLYDFHPPVELWAGCYKVQTLDKIFYVKICSCSG